MQLGLILAFYLVSGLLSVANAEEKMVVPIRSVVLHPSTHSKHEADSIIKEHHNLLQQMIVLVHENSPILSRFSRFNPSVPAEMYEYLKENGIRTTALYPDWVDPKGADAPLALIFEENGRSRYFQTADTFSNILFKRLSHEFYGGTLKEGVTPLGGYTVTLLLEHSAHSFEGKITSKHSLENAIEAWAVKNHQLAYPLFEPTHFSPLRKERWQTTTTSFWQNILANEKEKSLNFTLVREDGSSMALVGVIFRGKETLSNLSAYGLAVVDSLNNSDAPALNCLSIARTLRTPN